MVTVGKHKLYRGDCLDVMAEIPDKSIDMILCDLPYGTTACKWDSIIPFAPLWEHYRRIIKDRGAIVLFGSEPFSSYLRLSNIVAFKHDWIWEKHQGTNPVAAKFSPMKCHESISVFCFGSISYFPQMWFSTPYSSFKSNKTLGDIHGNKSRSEHRDNPEGSRYPRSVQYFQGDKGLHPTQKPVALLEYLIRTYTMEGETVLDNCMGSGSTIVACENTKRIGIGIEKDNHYFDVAVKRIRNTCGILHHKLPKLKFIC